MGGRRVGWWVLVGGVVLPLIYVPTLGTRFDFIDDGNLVYPAKPMPPADRAGLVWAKIRANYDDLGPFRPVLWVHWELFADLFQGSELAWRLARLGWCMLAATAFLWLLAELGIPGPAALGAVALAMWNPYRGEIWTSLTLAEGVAMPYALLALVCARRAAGSNRAWPWDIAGTACVLASLGCKNTFAALVPAQVCLRLLQDSVPWREAWRRHGRRALLLAATLIAPIAHMIYFKLNWHAGQYRTDPPSLSQLARIGSGLAGAMSLDFLGVGLLLSVLLMSIQGRAWLAEHCSRYRAAIVAGSLLLACGVIMYLPMRAMSGRYSMPAVWGLDIMFATLLGGVLAMLWSLRLAVARAALAIGLAMVALACVGKQQQFAARARVLWQALEWVEREAPANAVVAWQANDRPGGLNVEEGVHFQWHLAARGRGDIRVTIVDQDGRTRERREFNSVAEQPVLAIRDGSTDSSAEGRLDLVRWSSGYWLNRRRYECCAVMPGTGP